jgi:hypothetical protein
MWQVFGTIQNPTRYGGLGEGGLNNFVSNLLAFLGILGGIIVFINFIIAGYQYLSSQGNPQMLAAAGNKILGSLIGLIIIVAAFVIASIIGLVFFGNAGFLLQPTFFKLSL